MASQGGGVYIDITGWRCVRDESARAKEYIVRTHPMRTRAILHLHLRHHAGFTQYAVPFAVLSACYAWHACGEAVMHA